MAAEPQFTLYSTVVGPNGMYSLHLIVTSGYSSVAEADRQCYPGWKVAMVLAELGLTYKTIYLDFSKSEPE